MPLSCTDRRAKCGLHHYVLLMKRPRSRTDQTQMLVASNCGTVSRIKPTQDLRDAGPADGHNPERYPTLPQSFSWSQVTARVFSITVYSSSPVQNPPLASAYRVSVRVQPKYVPCVQILGPSGPTPCVSNGSLKGWGRPFALMLCASFFADLVLNCNSVVTKSTIHQG